MYNVKLNPKEVGLIRGKYEKNLDSGFDMEYNTVTIKS